MIIAETLARAIVTAAVTTCLANRCPGIWESISIQPATNPEDGWNLGLVALNRKDGTTLVVDLLRPVGPTAPMSFQEMTRARLAGAERLALLLDLLPDEIHGEVVRIPLA